MVWNRFWRHFRIPEEDPAGDRSERNGCRHSETTQICEELGVEPAKVIAITGHDTQSAVVSVPTQEKDFIFISCGTWSLFGTELDGPVIGEKSLECNVQQRGRLRRHNDPLKNIIGLWLCTGKQKTVDQRGKRILVWRTEKMALEAEPFQSFIDPDAPEFVAAGNIPERIREFCRRTGQKVPETIGEIMCCINQSLAMKYRYALEQIESCTGKHYPVINMIGGGIQSKLLCQMTAGAAGRKSDRGTGRGNRAGQYCGTADGARRDQRRRGSEKDHCRFRNYMSISRRMRKSGMLHMRNLKLLFIRIKGGN